MKSFSRNVMGRVRYFYLLRVNRSCIVYGYSIPKVSRSKQASPKKRAPENDRLLTRKSGQGSLSFSLHPSAALRDSRILSSGRKDVDRSWLHPVYSVQRNTFGDTTLNVHLVSGDVVYEYAQSGPIFCAYFAK